MSKKTFYIRIFLFFAYFLITIKPSFTKEGTDWLSFGGVSINNNRNSPKEKIISINNVNTLKIKYIINTIGSVSSTPVIYNDLLFFPDWAGYIYCVNTTENGKIIWSYKIYETYFKETTKNNNLSILSRNTFAIDKKEKIIIFGTIGYPVGGFSFVIAIDFNGNLLWKTLLSNHNFAIITQSATIFEGNVFIGTSSNEELASGIIKGYQCCTFQGSFAKLDLKTGKIIWQIKMMPNNYDKIDGYSGNAVWGSAPAIDPKERLVYIATGNNYEIPKNVSDCIKNSGDDILDQGKCLDPNNLVDSFVAIEIDTGNIRWNTRLNGPDTWNGGCGGFGGAPPNLTYENCPDPKGDDFDFGQAPMLVNVCFSSNNCRKIVIAASKSGFVWALDALNGKIIWSKLSGPSGPEGGSVFGSATDGKRVYVSQYNGNKISFNFTKPAPGNFNSTSNGFVVALDILTGEILWESEDPNIQGSKGPLSVANGIVYYGSLDKLGHFYALNAHTGEILFTFQTGGSVGGGPSIVDGVVYIGSGYENVIGGTGNNKTYALEPN